ncbi:AAA family ATPase [Aspergillus aculeatinus CBS 121060]|uniref:AAA family ATPase n=1 Tax=Aspergillus aculeatinus CBS 121060 TaxID=1448322 RepID=A0ACD1HNC9_9EURO|nr:AAA family ATPase [Aspergillus aculeatinus CBS 121060]RAH75108.1 AAA family ATPase [Aspergillus aculeatinus CBS 121060]
MATRSDRLTKYLSLIEKGKRRVERSADAKLFLESLSAQEDSLRCIERVLASPSLLEALQNSFRVDSSTEFVNTSAAEFLSYIRNPIIESFGNGQFLRQLVSCITNPRTFWTVFLQAHTSKKLSEHAELSFAWLLLKLFSSPGCSSDFIDTAENITQSFLDSTFQEVRTIGYRIQNIAKTIRTKVDLDDSYRPGGRHDNDFEDFREISILPTPDEIASVEIPYYRRMCDVYNVSEAQRAVTHYDNQFRLLREDLLAELRNDLQIARGQKKGRRSAPPVRGLCLTGVGCGTDDRRRTCYLEFACTKGLPHLSSLPKADRKKLLDDNPHIFRHQAFGCLLSKMDIVAFVTLDRGSSDLPDDLPTLALVVSGTDALTRVFTCAKMGPAFTFLPVNTPIFAYEPILERLQQVMEFPLSQILLASEPKPELLTLDDNLATMVGQIQTTNGESLDAILATEMKVSLDDSQLQSLLNGLQQSVSTIQGPPGTGKSYLGALIAKILHDKTCKTMMVICYTNHALDQFLENLLDIGIPESSMVRLGARSTPRTKHLGLFEQSIGTSVTDSWSFVLKKREDLNQAAEELKSCSLEFNGDSITTDDILEYLEFSDESDLFDAFTIPDQHDGMKQVGRHGRKIDRYYLWDAWVHGRDAGIFRDRISAHHAYIWELAPLKRKEMVGKWRNSLLHEKCDKLVELIKRFNQLATDLDEYYYHKRHAAVLEAKRIVACTTNAAARYARALRVAKPDIVIVEEAGEILESHILTAMTLDTKQLVLIGDHKQLRPKVNNYNLSVEKGDGFDLNRSLFERLIAQGYPHTSLAKQHRMRPELSRLVRQLTYPELQDSESTLKRPRLRGFQENIVFVDHCHPERELRDISERRDPSMKTSKQNLYEVEMVLKVVKYLGQQGYGTDDMVILTPYLGQLFLLRTELSKTNDPLLNDLDSNDLLKAGLLTLGSPKVLKSPIRISTIDNYQGEERDIVVASLTRSNETGDIGFMAAPERVNVLLSRALNALVMIGNGGTFLKSRKGHLTWQPLFEMLRRHGHVYAGFPLKCERHPDRQVVIRSPKEFDTACPDGGCSDPCSAVFACGIHSCTRRCHRAEFHGRIKCTRTMEQTCPKNHKYYWECYQGAPRTCPTCLEEAVEAERRKREDAKLEAKRRATQLEHAKKLSEIEERIRQQRQVLTDKQGNQDRRDALARKEEELKSLTAAADRTRACPPTALPGAFPADPQPEDGTRMIPLQSEARDEWQRQKQDEGQSNEALDTLMDMIGLESVKESFLGIKAKVDVVVRQGASLAAERFGAALLGNPGTGKTTVARLYARFLSMVGVIPGSFFVETSGSKLANGGVQGCQKHLEEIKSNGGGALFIDEAYQLTSGNSTGGSSVLDFLLAEVENLTRKVVFIIAGYNKNMESFFAHNPGVPSRFPVELQFKDYSDEELQSILQHHMHKKYNGRMRVEEGTGGLYMRIVARRVGRGRGREGFGNARAVNNVFARITERQAKRLQRQHLLGPDPRTVLKKNATWGKLQALTGLQSVKQSVEALFDTVQFNYARELAEKPLVEFSLNKVFVGNPGTGKTTVAKLYGKLLADMGYLSNGEVVVKNPSDFIGNVIGGSEAATKGILASTLGKVLVIDEAYMLGGSSSGSGPIGGPDIYKVAVIDTLVAEVQSVPGDDRCVLLLGYRDAMEKMFQRVNEGLSRRFPMSTAFDFQDFSDDDLQEILALKLKQAGFHATKDAKLIVRQCLARARNRPNFGNAGEVDIHLDKAKLRHQQRLSARKTRNIDILEPLDFDPDYDREQKAVTNCRKLFEGVVGSEHLVAQLEGYQNVVRNMKRLGLDPRQNIPFNFLFRGPPGSGKTSTARRMGQIFYDMGILATTEVIESSASDLVAQYVGQTGPKTERLLEKGLGRVLFIDEAYRLADGTFGKEAMDELVDRLTKEKFHKKLIVILAGYEGEINRLMASNPGLTSRFSETVSFQNLTVSQCWVLLRDSLGQLDRVDQKTVHDPDDQFKSHILASLEYLSTLPGWGNGRDVKTISDAIIRKVFSCPQDAGDKGLALTQAMVIDVLESTIEERRLRATATKTPQTRDGSLTAKVAPFSAPSFSKSSVFAVRNQARSGAAADDTSAPASGNLCSDEGRDPGVSDEVWMQLQADKKRSEEQSNRDAETLRREESIKRQLKSSATEADGDELREYEEQLRSLARERVEIEERKKQEEAAQQKLQEMGVCPVGFRWIKQATGYRCAGGSHFVSSAQLN